MDSSGCKVNAIKKSCPLLTKLWYKLWVNTQVPRIRVWRIWEFYVLGHPKDHCATFSNESSWKWMRCNDSLYIFFYKFNSLVITMNPLTQTTPLNFTYWKPFGDCQNEMFQLFCFTEYPLTLASQEDILSIDSLRKLMRYLEYAYS